MRDLKLNDKKKKEELYLQIYELKVVKKKNRFYTKRDSWLMLGV